MRQAVAPCRILPGRLLPGKRCARCDPSDTNACYNAIRLKERLLGEEVVEHWVGNSGSDLTVQVETTQHSTAERTRGERLGGKRKKPMGWRGRYFFLIIMDVAGGTGTG